jgi:integrase
LPENESRHIYLSQQEVNKLCAAIEHQPTRDAVMIAAYAGLRLGEIMRLEPDNVRRGCLYVATSKSGRPRVVPIHPAIRSAVKRLPLPCGQRWITRHFEAAREVLKHKEWRFHDLRHTNASWLIAAGADLVTVRDLLGHSSLAVTSRYTHLQTKHLKAAVRRIGR